MEDLTFGEQVKIILSRKGMTIKELAELIEDATGKKMSRQNLTQRLGRDNFQEQDMRMIAAILGCPFQLSIFPLENAAGEKTESMEELLLKYVKNPRVQPRRKKSDMDDGIYQQVLVFDKDSGPEETVVKENKASPEKESAAAAPKEEYISSSPTATKKMPDIAAVMANDAQKQPDETPAVENHAEKQPDGTSAVGNDAQKRPDKTDIMSNADSQESVGEGDMEELLELDVLDAEDSEDLEEADLPEQSTEGMIGITPASAIVAAEKKGEKTVIEERDMTIGELYDIHKELNQLEDTVVPVQDTETAIAKEQSEAAELAGSPEQEEPGLGAEAFEPVIQYSDAEENLELGEMNPYTGREYQTNSVRMHPTRLGYVQVYDRLQHGWTDMTEWAFLGYQERKKALLGRDYEPPIYLD